MLVFRQFLVCVLAYHAAASDRHLRCRKGRKNTGNIGDRHLDVHSNEKKDTQVPEPSMFKMKWEALKKKVHSHASLPDDVHLVLAVFSTAGDKVYQDAIRATWMQHTGVCVLSHIQQQGCTVYVAFVIGNGATRSPVLDGDMLILNTPENMNEGKSFAFFQFAARAFPWATHVGKMDMDTFPNLPMLVDSLLDPSTITSDDRDVYVGQPVDHYGCGGSAGCPPQACGSPLNNEFLSSSNPACWVYLQGGMYLMSRRLAEKVSEPEGYWDKHKDGIEDLVTGRAISIYGQQVRTRSASVNSSGATQSIPSGAAYSIRTWNPKAWFHYGKADTYGYPEQWE